MLFKLSFIFQPKSVNEKNEPIYDVVLLLNTGSTKNPQNIFGDKVLILFSTYCFCSLALSVLIPSKK